MHEGLHSLVITNRGRHWWSWTCIKEEMNDLITYMVQYSCFSKAVHSMQNEYTWIGGLVYICWLDCRLVRCSHPTSMKAKKVLYKGKHCILFIVSFMYIEKHVLVEYELALKSIHIMKTMALWIVLLPVIRWWIECLDGIIWLSAWLVPSRRIGAHPLGWWGGWVRGVLVWQWPCEKWTNYSIYRITFSIKFCVFCDRRSWNTTIQ